jgi:NAD(P)-dependent dehydrogenase (short-subunit alcohol dehydrogenase family)
MQLDANYLQLLRNHKFLITGAGRGVGREIAKILALHKAKTVLADINRENLDETVKICKLLGGEAFGLVYDAGNISSGLDNYTSESHKLVADAVEILGGLDHVILQHTLPQYHPVLIESTPGAVSQKALQHILVNYMGYLDTAIASLPHLLKDQSNQSITYVSSLAASIPVPNCAQYAASKAAIESFFDCLSLELAQSNINLNINKVVFSMVTTPVLIEAMTKSGNSASLSHGVSPIDAAWAVVKTSVSPTSTTKFVPASSSILISLYSVIPRLVRFLVDTIGKTSVLSTPSNSPSFLSQYFK